VYNITTTQEDALHKQTSSFFLFHKQIWDKIMGHRLTKILKNYMVSKYFNYVLVLAFLVGVTAPLPQVRDQLTRAFDLSNNSALAFGSVTSASSSLLTQCSTPEQVVNILARAGIIPTAKVNDALRLVKSLPGSDGRPVPVAEVHNRASTTMPRVHVSNWNITKGNVITSPAGIWSAAYPSISFTLTNLGNDPIYVSKNSRMFASTTISGGIVSATSVIASGSTTGDTVTSYIVNGSRTFTLNFAVQNIASTTATTRIKIAQLNYGLGYAQGQNSNLSVLGNLENAFVIVP